MITGTARRRSWPTEAKLRIIEESFEPGATVSSVARRNGVAANLLNRWRRLSSEGGSRLWLLMNLSWALRTFGVLRIGPAILSGFQAARRWRWRSFGKLWPEAGQNNRSCGRCRRLRALPDEACG